MKAMNYECFKLEEKTTRSFKKDKNNFIGDKFGLSICYRRFIWLEMRKINSFNL